MDVLGLSRAFDYLQNERVMLVLSSFLVIAYLRRKVLPKVVSKPHFSESKRKKYREYAFSVCWHVSASLLTWMLMGSYIPCWWKNSFDDYRIASDSQCSHARPPPFTLLVMIGYYLDEVVYLFLGQDHKKKDHLAMTAHHFFTIVALEVCQWYGYRASTIAAYFLHDVCDVFLELAKLFHYENCRFGAVLNFVVLVLTWIVNRLILFPLVFYLHYKSGPKSTIVTALHVVPLVLYLLDWYWFGMIMRIVLNGAKKDVRDSDDEGEDVPATRQKAVKTE